MFKDGQFSCSRLPNFTTNTPNDSEDDDTDDSFEFRDAYDELNISHQIGGDYDRSWGTYAIESDPWDDKKCPYVNILNKAELKLNKEEMEGNLTIRMVAACSSYLSKSPITQQYVLCKCNLSRCGLKNIGILQYRYHFEYIDLSFNNLTSVSALENAAMLMYLDVSHNMLDKLLEFRPPLNLTFVNYSFNCITKMEDLEQYWSIVKLNLSHNDILDIEGIDQLKYLQDLDLSYNAIQSIENIENLQNLISLNLRNNKINQTESSLKNLHQLRFIDVSHNEIKTLKMFRSYSLKIKQIIISHNMISNLLQLTHLQHLPCLLELDVSENPIASHNLFWDISINCLRVIKVLNNTYVTSAQKLQIDNRLNPPISSTFGRKKNMLRLLNSLRTTRMVCECLLPANIPPPPMIVLVGPLACKKNKTAIRFATIEENVKLLINHTTRPKTKKETNGLHYHFISHKEFEDALKKGQFLTVLETFGQMFGMHKKELEQGIVPSKHNTVFITHTDLISALIIRDHGYMPTILLAIPKNEDTHRAWIKEQYLQEYVHSRCDYLFNKQIQKITNGVAMDAANVLDNIMYSIYMMDEVIDRASTGTSCFVNHSDLGLIEDSVEEEREEKQLTDNLELQTDQQDDTENDMSKPGTAEKSCLRKKEHAKDKLSPENSTIHRPMVRFGETEENFLSTDDDDAVSLVMLGYDSEETFLINSLREVQEVLKSPDDLQMFKTKLESDGQIENKSNEENLDKEKPLLTLQYFKKFKCFAKESDIFVDSVIKARNLYIDYHADNPGAFSDVLLTDEPEEKVMSKLKQIANKIRKPKVFNDVYSYLGEHECTRMINERKKELVRAFECSQSTTTYQQIAVENYVTVQTNAHRYDGK